MNIQESAASLLLRSPHLSVSHIMSLLDISDREFRQFITSNHHIAELMNTRRDGKLESCKPQPRECSICNEWFMPYASARHCSDDCKKAAQIQNSRR